MTIRFPFAAAVSALALAACAQPTETEPTAGTGDTSETTAAGTASNDMTPQTVDVVEAASATKKLDTFLQTALEAGIGEQLAQAGEITIFAPIDAAFTAVPNLDTLKADKPALRKLLERHAVAGNYPAAKIPQGTTELTALSGDKLTVTNENGQVSVRTAGGMEATVVQADITGDNGVVHAVNTVLVK